MLAISYVSELENDELVEISNALITESHVSLQKKYKYCLFLVPSPTTILPINQFSNSYSLSHHLNQPLSQYLELLQAK